MARIGDGAYLLDEDCDPIVKILAPVMVFPAYLRPVGKRCFNYNCYEFSLSDFGGCPEVSLIPIAGLGMVVVDTNWFTLTFPNRVREWNETGVGPGTEPIDKLRAAWAKLRPGWWAVTDYHDSDGRHNYHWEPPQGCYVTEEVSWEIWT